MAINEALAEYLALYHKGEVNAVTSRELECSFQMRGSELRREINALRGDGIPICSFEGGYYYAATAEELERTIRQLDSLQIRHLGTYIDKEQRDLHHPWLPDVQPECHYHPGREKGGLSDAGSNACAGDQPPEHVLWRA